jgi:RES domain-containing protein
LIRAWRLVASRFADRIFSGAGAYRHGGRWNSPGRAVVYLSAHLSLSALETLVHKAQMHMLSGFKYVWVDIAEASITTLEAKELPSDWAAVPAGRSTQLIGDHWFDEKISLALKVPSTVISVESNFLLNTTHPRFQALQAGDVQDFVFDKRLLDPTQSL